MKKRALSLAAFMPEEIEKMGFQQLLSIFMDEGRVNRAKGIKDKEVIIKESSDTQIKAKVREYNIVFDLRGKVILHDCADWSRCIPAKQFCKHLGKVLLLIPQEKAVNILRQVALEREKWEFKPYIRQV